jgi:dipeptidyl aminopeptidase/acylaminoacyl peptidase
MNGRSTALLVSPLLLAACAADGGDPDSAPAAALEPARDGAPCPLFGGESADHLIAPGESHFAHLWMLTTDGENAEAYWDSRGDELVFQRRSEQLGIECDRIFVVTRDAPMRQVSNGRGRTTCAYFMPGDRSVIYASTHGMLDTCPPPIDPAEYRRLGYFWPVHPEYDLWVQDLGGGEPRRLTDVHGYDAEATVSPRGDRIVFTSSRSGDLELWTCDLQGGDLRQVTDTPGYDGGAFFSHDGKRLVFRSQAFTPGKEEAELAETRALMAEWRVRPSLMELQLANADGSERRTLGPFGGASFAPYFFPDDRRVIFASNHHDDRTPRREFDLFAIDVDGQDLERITTSEGFDSFPMFSPDGRYLVFASNRGQRKPGETNLFLAEWK